MNHCAIDHAYPRQFRQLRSFGAAPEARCAGCAFERGLEAGRRPGESLAFDPAALALHRPTRGLPRKDALAAWALGYHLGHQDAQTALVPPPLADDDDEQIAAWTASVDVLQNRVYGLASDDEVFWGLNGIVLADPRLGATPDDVFALVHTGYLNRTLTSLRAAIDEDADSASVCRVLASMGERPKLLSRARFVALYPPSAAERASGDFDQHFSAQGLAHVPPAFFDARRRRLHEQVQACRRYTNKVIAHWDAKGAAPSIQYTTIRRSVVAVIDEVHMLKRLLTGSASSDVVPTKQYNWFDSLRFAWLPEGWPPPNTNLDGVRAEMQR